MSNLDERTLTISGVKVVFPCKPYPSQFGMMDRVIKGLERKQNSLLESPTGSGKSLALLCSALAWQVAQHEKITRENIAASAGSCKPCQCGAAASRSEYSSQSKPASRESKGNEKVSEVNDDDDDDDFQPSSKLRTPIVQSTVKKRKRLGIKYDDDETGCCSEGPPVKCTCNDTGQSEAAKKQKVPKIYFGTRTHKQIAQITRELKKTAYHDARMVILASREYMCIHPEVTVQKSKSEGCRERLDINGQGCTFNDKSKRVLQSQGQLQEHLTTAWDLEDFVATCSKKKACPYFVSRNLKEGADIVFCPYNYLIDPLVRKSMDISLKDQVVILDEAHNMEDCARDAASGSLTTDQITQGIHNLQQLMEHNMKYVEHLKLRNMLENLLNFIEGNNSNLDQSDYDTSYKVWSGFDIVVRLKGIGLGPDSFQEYQRCFEQAIAQSEDEQMSMRDRRNQLVKLSSNTQKLLEQLFQILDYMYRNDLKFVEDYRVAIMKSMQYVSNRDTNDRWLGKNRRGGSRIVVYTLNFWCMNPAVAFSDFSCCRNVVLSSGTLSPMSSFASELGTPFPIQLEANHIIDDKQVWVGAIGTGPGGSQLQAVYRNIETLTFQDELGNFIHQVCTKVPHGVLCFLPSYRALEKFIHRWKLTGLWGKLANRKRVMVEPRAADREDFDGMMKAFYDVVKGDLCSDYLDGDDCSEDDTEIDGALFFAVCRGKVSEGMDFADNNARAVITVGIPFPSFKDVQVKLKREYNDKHRIDRGLLSGSDWYEIQAFRALNQALGRCIRHRKDWGALIMVDDRFVKKADKYCKSLSRWVRSKVRTFDCFSDFLGSMSKFTETMEKEMPVIEPDTSFIPCTPGTGRRDSIYKRQSLDNSYMNTTDQASEFRSPPMSLTQTPKSVKGTNPVPLSTPVTSPSIQQRIMNVINSGTAPNDLPYYVILDQGTPKEQAFLIDPGKHAGMNPVQTQVPGMVPQVPGKQILMNMSGTSEQKQVLLMMPQLPVPDISLLQPQAVLQGTSHPNFDNKGGNQQDSVPSKVGERTENITKEDKKADIVVTLEPSTLPVEEQLKKFVSSVKAPRNQAYYVVVNKGQKNERAFFIEPNKKGTSKAASEQKTEGEKFDGNILKAEENVKPVQYEQDLKPVKLEQEVAVPDFSTEGDPEPQNKFLKFCQLPKTPSCKVPVATVTPQRPVKTEQGSSPDISSAINGVKADPDYIQQQRVVAGTSDPQQVTGLQQPTCTSPLLFEDQSVDTTNTHAKASADNLDMQNDPTTKKKPIFKRRDSLVTRNQKPKQVDRESKDIGDNIKEIRKEKGNIDVGEVDVETDDSDLDFIVESTERRTRCKTLGKVNRQKADEVKQGRKLLADGKVLQETHGEANVADDGKIEASGNEGQSDEEFLNTRRRGARKRKSTSKYEAWTKRSKKGVVYDDVDDKAEKENKVDNKLLSSVKCGKHWMKAAQYERHKRHPEFLAGVFKKNTELLYFPCMKTEDNPLQPLLAQTDSRGLQLNSVYHDAVGCCIEYLVCKQCRTDTVIGARVLLADSTSQYKSGQTWILSSEVKQ